MLAADPASGPVRPARRWGIFAVMSPVSRRLPKRTRRYALSVAVFLFCIFVVFPLIELGVVIAVADWIGILPTIGALIAMSAVGVWMVKRQGFAVVRRTRAAMNRGELPGTEMLDGAMLVIAGLLCIVPGFISGTIGLLLLIGPILGPLAVDLCAVGLVSRRSSE